MNKKVIISTLFIFLFISCEKQNKQLKSEKIYQQNFAIFIETCWNKKDFSPLNKIVDLNYSRTVNNINIIENSNQLKANMQVFITGFPDLFVKINDIVFKDNQAFLHWTFTGTNTGVFGENPATGKKIFIKGFTIIYFTNEGEILNEDVHYNELDLLQQLGYTLNKPNFK